MDNWRPKRGPYIRLDAISLGSLDEKAFPFVTFFIDMRPYIDAYVSYVSATLEELTKAKEDYEGEYAKICSLFRGFDGCLWWQHILDALDDSEFLLNVSFRGSPVETYMADSFVEIIKNSVDQAIMSALDPCAVGYNGTLELKVLVDTQTYFDAIAVVVSDTGQGFRPDFLHKMNTPVGRTEYILRPYLSDSISSDKTPDVRSREYHGSTKELIKLFGGKGLGLRILTAFVEHAAALEGDCLVQKYIKPKVSEIRFSNIDPEQGGGAIMEIITSVSSLEYLPTVCSASSRSCSLTSEATTQYEIDSRSSSRSMVSDTPFRFFTIQSSCREIESINSESSSTTEFTSDKSKGALQIFVDENFDDARYSMVNFSPKKRF